VENYLEVRGKKKETRRRGNGYGEPSGGQWYGKGGYNRKEEVLSLQ